MAHRSFLFLLAVVFVTTAFHSTAFGRNVQPLQEADSSHHDNIPKDSTCHLGASDFVFVIDQSGSIGPDNYTLAKRFAADLTEYMSIGASVTQSQVGVVLFDSSSSVAFYLNTYPNNTGVYNGIMGLTYSGGGTNIANGMNTALSRVFVPSAGQRTSVPGIMFVMTDGSDNTDVVTAHNQAVQRGITIFAIGIGSGVSMAQLIKIAGDSQHVFTINNFNSLHEFLPAVCTQMSSAAPQFTAAMTSPIPTTAAAAQHSPRQCACTSSKIWLDIVLAVDASDSMNQAGLNQAKATLKSMFRGITVGQTQRMNSRVGIVYFANTATTLASLNTYASSDEVVSGIDSIPFLGTGTGGKDVNLEAALQGAAQVFGTSGRSYGKRMIILLTSSNQIGPFADPHAIATQLKSEDVVIVTVAFTETIEADPPAIDFSSPGRNFTNKDPNFFQEMLNAFCDANCFCPPNWIHFIDYPSQKYAECIYPGDFPATWEDAQTACKRTLNGFLVDELSIGKESFVKNNARVHFATANPFGFWIGLKNINGAATWDRNNATDSNSISNGDYQNWAPSNGFPSPSGNCVAEQYYGSGNIATKWFVKDCANAFTGAFNYYCQIPSCDTDTWCYG